MPNFKKHLSDLVASSGIPNDDWLNEVFEFYMQSKSQKPRGIQKYIRDVQQFEELTSQVNDLFKAQLNKVLKEEERQYHALDELQKGLDDLNKKLVVSTQMFEALTQKYELLKDDNEKHKETIESLNKTIKDKDQQIAQDRKTVATLEKVITEFDMGDRLAPSTVKQDRTNPKEDDKPKRDGRGSGRKTTKGASTNELPPQLENQFEAHPISDETKRLQSEIDVQEADERKNYGSTISKEKFTIEVSSSERPLETSPIE